MEMGVIAAVLLKLLGNAVKMEMGSQLVTDSVEMETSKMLMGKHVMTATMMMEMDVILTAILRL